MATCNGSGLVFICICSRIQTGKRECDSCVDERCAGCDACFYPEEEEYIEEEGGKGEIK